MAAADASSLRTQLSERGSALTVAAAATLFVLPAFVIGGQFDGVRAGVVLALSIAFVTAVFGRAAFRGTLPRPFNGTLVIGLLALLAGVSVLSVGWSLLPGASYLDAVRTIAYTAILAGGALFAQLIPQRARELLAGVGIAALLICAYSLISRVFPGWFPESDAFARLRMPFEYWNAVGAVAVFGLIAALWAGTTRSGPAWIRIASYPAGGVFAVTLMLSQSRGALLAAVLAIGIWLLLAPRRLRSAGWLAPVAGVTLLVVAWAYSRPALSEDKVLLAARESTGRTLGLVLIVALALLAAAGWGIERRRNSAALPPRRRFEIGRVLLILLAIAPFVLVAGVVVTSDEGVDKIGNSVSDLFDADKIAPPNEPGRLTQTNSLRARYWNDAFKVWDNHKWHGTGGDTYSVARLPYRHDILKVSHAHGFVPQTMSDLGLLGLLIVVALALAWLYYAFRFAGAARRAPTRWLDAAEDARLADIGILLLALSFGIQSAIDWTWFIPGVTIIALAAAGWVAGSPAAHGGRAPQAIPEGRRARTIRAVAIALVGLSVAYAVYQPTQAARKVEAGFTIVDSDPARALKLGLDAHDLNPAAADPFFLISSAQSNLDRPKAADETLMIVANQQPANPETWLRLAQYRLTTEDDPGGAIAALRPLLYQSPNNERGNILLAEARDRRIEKLIAAAAERERRRIKRELKRIKRELEAQGVDTSALQSP